LAQCHLRRYADVGRESERGVDDLEEEGGRRLREYLEGGLPGELSLGRVAIEEDRQRRPLEDVLANDALQCRAGQRHALASDRQRLVAALYHLALAFILGEEA